MSRKSVPRFCGNDMRKNKRIERFCVSVKS